MKKILTSVLLFAVIVSALCFAVDAALLPLDSKAINENGFSLTTFHNTRQLFKNDDLMQDIEDSLFWVADQAYINTKFFGFIGPLAVNPTDTYQSIVQKGGGTISDLVELHKKDQDWLDQYERIKKSAKVLDDLGLPYGVSYAIDDYLGGMGLLRDNLQGEYFPVTDVLDGYEYDYADDNNYYVVVENNGVKYMVFILEPWPRAAVLDWVNLTLDENKDKYAVIYTYSYIDSSGNMYTMWDWDEKGYTRPDKNTYLKYVNISSMGKPRDGDQLWNYCFSKHDNILAVISIYGASGEITATKQKNANGVEMAAICASADKVYSSIGIAMLNLSFSEDNKTVTCSYLSPFNGYLDSSVKTVKLNKIGTLAEPKIELPKIATQYNGDNKAYIFGYEGNTFRPNANMTRAEACTIFARLILETQTIPDGYTTRFSDVKVGDWFHNAVAYLDQNGFFNQLTASTYKPNEPITRAEFVDLANKASSLQPSSKKIEFTDVPTTHFYYESVMAAAGAGIVNGYEDSTFRPDNTITRAEVVTVVNRLLGLKSTTKTIDTTKLENEFVDIGTHWARLNILMASNSNVHGSYYYNKTLDGVTETAKNITFANKHFSFTVEKRSGKVLEIINLYTNENINDNATNQHFIYLLSTEGAKIVPVGMSIDGNRIKVDFKNGSSAYLLVEITDDYMTFEIDSEPAPGILTVVYGVLETNIKISEEPDSFRINGIGMTAWTQVTNYLLGEYTNTIAKAHTNYDAGVMGSKYGIAFSKYSDAIPFMKQLMDAVDPSVGLALKSAGAYTKEWEPIYDDYAIRGDTNPETIDEYIALCKEYGVDTIDLHMGSTTFLNGNFKFAYTETGTAKEYYEKIGYKFKEAGLRTALHSYAWYIDYTATDITTDPYWQKQLLKRDDVYTLAKNMTKFRTNVPTAEDASAFDTTTSFFVANSNFILVDQEIIKVGKGTADGFVSIKRGQCGTEATEHKKGAKIYHLSGHFGKLVPEYGSELFWKTADLMAEAYNDGGFDMLYFDAIDGCGADITSCYADTGWSAWYWHQMYIHRIVSQCERTPIVETSSGCGQEYNFRGRMGAYDYPSRAYKISISSHANNNLKAVASNTISTLGWWNFRPDEAPTRGMYNTIQKTQFIDDLDYLGMTAIIYDMTMVYNPLPSHINENPFLRFNISYYNNTYSKLRKAHYFSDEVKKTIIEKGGEWKVIEKAPGEYAFLQMYYSQANLGNDLTTPNYSFKGNNPFSTQTPFVRVEPRWSTEYEEPITLVEFDEQKTLANQNLNVTGLSVNMTNNMAMKVKVKGTGKDGDAILISLTGGLTSGESNGHSDYFIDLNFEGWKEFVMLDADNAEYDTTKYKFGAPIYNVGGDYGTVRSTPNFANIVKVVVYTCGNTAKSAQMSSITAYKQNQAAVKNPTVTVGSSKMTFNTEIEGGNYIEYYPTENKAYLYNNNEQTKTEISFTGTLNVASGNFTCTYSAEALTSSTLRARVTLGFSGEEISN